VIGEKERHMAKVLLFIRMEMYTLVNSKIIWQMDMEPLSTVMDSDMKGFGRIICNMGLARKNFLIYPRIMVTIIKAKRMDKVSSNGKMAQCIKENGRRIIYMEKDCILGQKVDHTKEVGATMKNMETVFTFGTTKSTKENGNEGRCMAPEK